MRGKRRNMLMGAVTGAVLVAALAGAVGAALDELAHPAMVIAFGLFGAVLGAFAWGAVAYERDHEAEAPTAGYREGVLAEVDDEAKTEPKSEPGLQWLARRRPGILLRLPLSRWL